MSNKKLYEEALADAKAVREAALANAKIALEEAFTPKLKEMISAKLSDELSEEYEESELEEDEISEDDGYSPKGNGKDYNPKKASYHGPTSDSKEDPQSGEEVSKGDTAYKKRSKEQAVDEDEIDETFSIDELLANLKKIQIAMLKKLQKMLLLVWKKVKKKDTVSTMSMMSTMKWKKVKEKVMKTRQKMMMSSMKCT
jgi:hypothetical protein